MTDQNVPSFEELAFKLGPQLNAYLKRMTGNGADADDLLQETMVRIASALPYFEGRASVKNWAFRIATNTAIDFLRKTRKTEFKEFSETEDVSDLDEEDRLVLDEMNHCVREVIDTLPPDYRAAIILFNLHGHSISEIAEILEISTSLAKVRVHRGKLRLKDGLGKQCDFYTTADGQVRCDRKNRGVNNS